MAFQDYNTLYFFKNKKQISNPSINNIIPSLQKDNPSTWEVTLVYEKNEYC